MGIIQIGQIVTKRYWSVWNVTIHQNCHEIVTLLLSFYIVKEVNNNILMYYFQI